MKIKYQFLALMIGAFFAVPIILFGQWSIQGLPYSFIDSTCSPSFPVVVLDSVNVDSLLIVESQDTSDLYGKRFGVNNFVDYGLDNGGQWDTVITADGDTLVLWRLMIASPGSLSMNLIFDEFDLPEAGRLYVYNSEKTMVLGGFSSVNNQNHGRFSTDVVQGDSIVLEYFEPIGSPEKGAFSLENVVSGFLDISCPHCGSPESCEVYASCYAFDWCREMRGVCVIINANRYSTGFLVNNIREGSDVSYIATAYHALMSQDGCYSPPLSTDIENVEDFIFRFGYYRNDFQHYNCYQNCNINSDYCGAYLKSAGNEGPKVVAYNAKNDFLLIEIDAIPAPENGIYAVGWTSIDPSASAGPFVSLHHPNGTPMMISQMVLVNNLSGTGTSYTNQCVSVGANFWELEVNEGSGGFGMMKRGASGAPLFDKNHRVVGVFAANSNGNPDLSSIYCVEPDASNRWRKKLMFSQFGADWSGESSVLCSSLDVSGKGAKCFISDVGETYTDGKAVPVWLYNKTLSGYYTAYDEMIVQGKLSQPSPDLTTGLVTMKENEDVILKAEKRIVLKNGVKIKPSDEKTFHAYINPVECTDYGIVVKSGNVPAIVRHPPAGLPADKPIPVAGDAVSAHSEKLVFVYPNPATSRTRIKYVVTEESPVHLLLVDQMGVVVTTILQTTDHFPGTYETEFDVSVLPSGTYYCYYRSANSWQIEKIMVAR